MGINKVILVGNLGKDPELRMTAGGTQVGSFSLATGERRKDQSGNWVDHTEWHNIVVFGKTAENCAQYLKKGRQAYVEGRIQTRKWQDKEGRDRWTTEIIANVVQFIGGREGAARGATASDIPEGLTPADALNGSDSSSTATFEDDDIPF